MRKYMVLFSLTVLAVILTQTAPSAIQASAPLVEVASVERQDMEISVFCTGKIEAGKSVEVNTEIPVVARPAVSVGDFVKSGDLLARVDTGATLEQIAALYSVPLSSVHYTTEEGEAEVYYNGQTYTLAETILSPTDGQVTQLNINEGEPGGVDQPLAVVSQGGAYQIKANVNESLVPKIKIGQRALITGSGFLGQYEGKVSSVSDSAKQVVSGSTTETVVETVFAINQIDSALKPGFTAKVEVIVDEIEQVLTVPYESLCRDTEGDFVYLAGDRRALRRDVLLGRESAQGVEVLAGLEEGDSVIVNPASIQKNGDFIRWEEAKQVD